jgi:corrinoid protein of di/trimethylamine methyltransferase
MISREIVNMKECDLYSGLENSVIAGKKDEVVKYTNMVIEQKLPVLDAINHGLVKGMGVVGDKYAKHEYFLPQVLMSANALYGGLNLLLPLIPKADADKQVVGVIGVVEGDVHDIGKNIVKTMLTAAGLDMHDFGKDVPIENFVNSVKENKAQLIAMSTLMTPTMDGMKAVADGLVENGDRPKVKIIIGGAPTSPAFQEEIGADMWAVNAQEAVKRVKEVF